MSDVDQTASHHDRRPPRKSRGGRRLGAARWPALVLIPALLVAAGLASDNGGTDAPSSAVDPQVLGPQIASSDSLGAFWFCAGGTGVENGFADHRVVLLNTTDQERFANIDVYASRPEGGERPAPRHIQSRVLPYSRSEILLRQSLGGQYVSATVEIDGGGVLVEHDITGPQAQGFDRAPCASSASAIWSLPIGTTDIAAANAQAREVLVFFNPFPADAVLDVQFSTEQGERGTPEQLKGFVVPGRSVVGVDVAAAGVPVSNEVAAEVVARSGRVVVDRIQSFTGFQGRAGVALSTGIPAPADSWVFPAGTLSAARHELLSVYNPNDAPAEVDVEVRPVATATSVSTEPFELTVQPHRHVQLDLAAEERMSDFVAQSTPYSLVVRSADGTRITAERLVVGTPGQPGGGAGTSTGTSLAGLRLVADLTGAQPGSALVLTNPSADSIARVQLSVFSEGTKRAAAVTASVDLEPGGRRSIPVEELGALPVIVESNTPIVAEREIVANGDRANAVAVPDAATASVAEPSFFTDLGG